MNLLLGLLLLIPAVVYGTYYYPGGYSYTSYTRHAPTLLPAYATYPQQPYPYVAYYKVWPSVTPNVFTHTHVPCVTPVAATSHFHVYRALTGPFKVKTNDANKTEHVFKPQFKWYQPFWSYEGSIQHFPVAKNQSDSGEADAKMETNNKEEESMIKAEVKAQKSQKKAKREREPTTSTTTTEAPDKEESDDE